MYLSMLINEAVMRIVPIIIGIAVVIFIWRACYKVAPTDKVLVVTGPGGRKFVSGTSTFVIPFLQRCDWLSLGVVQCELMTEQAIPTKDSQLIRVSAVANFQIGVNPVEIVDADGQTVTIDPREIAARNYLNQEKDVMKRNVTEVLLGKMREAVGKTDLTVLMSERDEFSENVFRAALDDMRNLGLELITFNVQDFSDSNGVIEAMGADYAAQIKREASLAQIEADQLVAERQNQFDLKQAELKTSADTAKAAADMVYETQTAEARKALNEKAVQAEIAAEAQRIELAEKKVSVTEREAQAEVRRAEAERQARAERAEAARIEAERAADADLYAAQKAADARRAEAAAEAEATRVTGEAEGDALRARGEGEAAGIRAQGEAYNEMDSPLILVQALIDRYPEIMAAAAKPLENVETITMYGTGNETALVGDTARTISQVTEAVRDSTGLDLPELLSAAVAGRAAGSAMTESMSDTSDAVVSDTSHLA